MLDPTAAAAAHLAAGSLQHMRLRASSACLPAVLAAIRAAPWFVEAGDGTP